MSSSQDDQSQTPVDERLKFVQEIEEKLQGGNQDEIPLSGPQRAMIVLFCATFFVFWSFVTATSPIPRGKENREQAAIFLNQQFPDRKLSPNAEESSTAPVAAVFYIIRQGTPEEATKAIDFATKQEFGNASPYVIERMESDDPQLRQSARDFLRAISGSDYGPDAAAWSDWWNDPPRTFFGVLTVGQHTLQMGITIASMLFGIVGLIGGTLWKRDHLAVIGSALLMLGWFLFIGVLGLRLVGSYDTCTFGGVEIIYHQGHGVVEGLEDARTGGAGLWLLLCLAFVGIPFLAMLLWFVISSLFFSEHESTDRVVESIRKDTIDRQSHSSDDSR